MKKSTRGTIWVIIFAVIMPIAWGLIGILWWYKTRHEKFSIHRVCAPQRNMYNTPWACESEYQQCMIENVPWDNLTERANVSLGRALQAGNQPYTPNAYPVTFPVTQDARMRYQYCDQQRKVCRMRRLGLFH